MSLFEEELNVLPEVEMSVDDYLKFSLENADQTTYCKGWDYLGKNIPKFLKELLKTQAY